LRAEKVTVDFDGFKAVQNLDFSLHAGEVHFLIGPNGAGKTTLLDVMCGRTRPASGRVLFKETHDLTRMQEHQISRLGVGRKFQAPSVFLSLSPRHNLQLAARGPRGVWANLRSRFDSQDKVEEMLKLTGLTERADVVSGEMSHGEKQWLEIGMLLAQEPDAVLLDEPAAGMTDAETDKMGEMLHRIAHKHSILVVEHDMEFVRRYAHRVTVMHEGRVLCAGSMEEVQNDPQVTEVYLGRRGERH
jgi:urea transport system ATP-binding protein